MIATTEIVPTHFSMHGFVPQLKFSSSDTNIVVLYGIINLVTSTILKDEPAKGPKVSEIKSNQIINTSTMEISVDLLLALVFEQMF